MEPQVVLHETHGVIEADISKVSKETLQDIINDRPDLDWIIDSSSLRVENINAFQVVADLELVEGRLLFLAVSAANDDVEDALDAQTFSWAPTANECFDLLAMAQIERELGL